MSERDTSQGICRHQPSTAIVVCSKVILCILPIAEITVGALYQNDCPKQHFFPIYLEVMGVFHLLLLGISFLPCSNQFTASSLAFSGLSILLFLCWFITSNVWIYSIYEPNINKTMTDVDPYCKTLYLFAFWTANMTYIPLGLFICCCYCCPRHLPNQLQSY
ncbi:transmembrane protein 272-like [Thunnus albacares]|uniref:transmembrane protein 272-like n=1 Tax=Thunnus albacares TaxID=8236 RepID=UPI001CF68504|nr:transmembrane protein 272-like [Thunnus albacares]XP_044196925.1 transmembrane protein 272-like [Thunnus albacares]XP_044196926.1 transmembrane protein 272-like [Thunnus albacares]XP_044196927.1 transmembrane protein 272-like [Thunnus albacares]XP_044196928.1 transmembrane protein 272-like [Thunnus albacares]XP_044196929.1 transmembrane protein 272-like [Thunnus albacares]XP_044196931.1 transmembrane protein 272-like [Thunnus albacares]XP_044196932.1 transmembrane protein 272-like [Thunnu